MALTHFAFGAVCATLLISYLLPEQKYSRTLIIGSGIWAMLPDFHHVVPIFEAQFRAAHYSLLSNLFWFHQAFDRADSGDSHRLAAVMLGVLLLVTLLAEERLYPLEERFGR